MCTCERWQLTAETQGDAGYCRCHLASPRRTLGDDTAFDFTSFKYQNKLVGNSHRSDLSFIDLLCVCVKRGRSQWRHATNVNERLRELLRISTCHMPHICTAHKLFVLLFYHRHISLIDPISLRSYHFSVLNVLTHVDSTKQFRILHLLQQKRKLYSEHSSNCVAIKSCFSIILILFSIPILGSVAE